MPSRKRSSSPACSRIPKNWQNYAKSYATHRLLFASRTEDFSSPSEEDILLLKVINTSLAKYNKCFYNKIVLIIKAQKKGW